MEYLLKNEDIEQIMIRYENAKKAATEHYKNNDLKSYEFENGRAYALEGVLRMVGLNYSGVALDTFMNSRTETIKFDERYDNEDDKLTTLYYIASKEFLYSFTGKVFPEAVSMEISLEFPIGHIEPHFATVMVSPTNKEGEDYDWYDAIMTKDEISELISLAEKG